MAACYRSGKVYCLVAAKLANISESLICKTGLRRIYHLVLLWWLNRTIIYVCCKAHSRFKKWQFLRYGMWWKNTSLLPIREVRVCRRSAVCCLDSVFEALTLPAAKRSQLSQWVTDEESKGMFPLPQRGHLWKTVWAPELPGGLAVASAAFAVHSRSAPSSFVHALPVLLLRAVPSNLLSANPSQSLRPEHPTQDSVTCRTLKFLPTGPAEMPNTEVRHLCMHTYFLLLEDLPHVKYCGSSSELSETCLF